MGHIIRARASDLLLMVGHPLVLVMLMHFLYQYVEMFDPDIQQDEVFERVGRKLVNRSAAMCSRDLFPSSCSWRFASPTLPLLSTLAWDSVIEGYNATLFAYGQTGSGKTYTILGDVTKYKTAKGIIPRTLEVIFKEIKQVCPGVCAMPRVFHRIPDPSLPSLRSGRHTRSRCSSPTWKSTTSCALTSSPSRRPTASTTRTPSRTGPVRTLFRCLALEVRRVRLVR